MTDKLIIFSAPMVRALLDGRKTQTRRIIKINGMLPDFCGGRGDRDDPTCWGWEDPDHGDWVTLEKEPGQRMGWRDWRGAYRSGDRLWVREAWRSCVSLDHCAPRAIGDRRSECGFTAPWGPVFYEADGTVAMWPDLAFTDTVGRKRPSIHMPRWASRLTLTVTDVRVQRVQEISDEDAMQEGTEAAGLHDIFCNGAPAELDGYPGCDCETRTPKDAFRCLWNAIHGPDAWDASPWVVSLTFDVHRRNIDSMGQA